MRAKLLPTGQILKELSPGDREYDALAAKLWARAGGVFPVELGRRHQSATPQGLFEETEHPRAPKGTEGGGQFTKKEGGDEHPAKEEKQPHELNANGGFVGDLPRPKAEALYTPNAVPSDLPSPETVEAGEPKKAKDGSIWVKAKKGGETSAVNGEFYKGGRWMPIHGLSPKQEDKPKPTEPQGGEMPKPPKEDSGRQKISRAPMTPEEIADEKQRREHQEKWAEMKAGSLGKIFWMGENLHGLKTTQPPIKTWEPFAESLGKEGVDSLVKKLEPIVMEQAKDDEERKSLKEHLEWQAENHGQYLHKGHAKAIPQSAYASILLDEALGERGTSFDHMHKIEQILKDIHPVSLSQSADDAWTWTSADKAAFLAEQIPPRERVELSTFTESKHPRGQPENKGEFAKKGQSTADQNPDHAEPEKTYEKVPAIRGTMAPAQRVGKGKDAKIVMADGRPVPEWIKPGMIAPTLTNVKIAVDPRAEVLVIGTKPNGETFTGYSDQFHMRNAALKFDRVQEMLRKHDKIFAQNQANREHPDLRDSADCTWLIDLQGTRPGGESDTKGLAKWYGQSMTPDMVTADDKGRISIKLRDEFGAEQSIPIKDKGTAERLKAMVHAGLNLRDTDYWLKSYGATTLEGRHIIANGSEVRLQFVGKEGVWHDHKINDPHLAAMLAERKAKAGDDGKIFAGTNARKLNQYQESLDGGKFTPKDFRTKRANLIALEEVGKMNGPFDNEKAYKKAVMAVAEKVSGVLGNKPAQALESYINPIVFNSWKGKQNAVAA